MMMKKILSSLMLIAIFVMPINVFAEDTPIYDYSKFEGEKHVYSVGGYLTDEQIAEYNAKMSEIETQYNINLVYVIFDDFEGDTQEFSDGFLNHANMGRAHNENAILAIVDMNARYADLYTHAEGIRAVSDSDVEYILDGITGPLGVGNYYNSLQGFYDNTKEVLDAYYYEAPFPYLLVIGVTVILSLIITSMMTVKQMSFHKQATAFGSADAYLGVNDFNLTRTDDNFVSTFTTRTKVEKVSSSSSGRGGGGGSSWSTSSGNTRGGGGRSF